ncbi:MAG: ABC transporter ATP-binding protein [Chloroflexota bacterium]|nr:ABC transporter ATP-binding protein [Chloroflexota bacterium]
MNLQRYRGMWVKATTHLRETGAAVAFVVGLVWKHAPVAGSLLAVSTIVAGATTPLVVWSVTGLIDALSEAAAAEAELWPPIIPWLLALLGALALRSVDFTSVSYLGERVGVPVTAAVQRAVHERAAVLPLSAFEQEIYYTKLETAQQVDGDRLSDLLENFTWVLSSVVGVAGLMALYVRAHWLLAVVLVATVALHALVESTMSRVSVEARYSNSPRRRERSYWSGLLSNRTAAPELRLFRLADQLLGRWHRAHRHSVAAEVTAQRKMALASLASVAVQEVIGLVMVIVLLLLALRQSISLGDLVALLYGLGRFRELTRNVGYGLQNLFIYRGELGHLRAFLALEGERLPLRTPRRGLPRPLREGVRFRDVSFTYPGSSRPAVDGVTLTLRPQERVALVGENGAGKTTLVRLLLGLYRPTHGAITVDGIDLAEIDPDEWRREATAVFQDFVRYPTTVRENIAYGDVAVLVDGAAATGTARQRITAAAARSGADQFIATLPGEYDAPLGKEWLGGVELSSGQWQRLAIARAYLRDAQIIVLDEPTAALDPRAEVAVYRQFSRAAAGRCAVLISHRLGAARLADRIVVLSDGRLVEEGSHDELLERGGAYAHMYRLQARWYTQQTDEDGRR